MIVSCDARALEWRTAAILSGDQVAIQEINNADDNPDDKSLDIHTKNQAAFSLPSRLVSKIFLFRCIFRGPGYSYSVDPDFRHVSTSPDFWEDVIDKFYTKYKGLDLCHQDWFRTVAAGRPIESPFQQRWYVPLKSDGTVHLSNTTNYPVQGTGNLLMSIARISLLRRLRTTKLNSVIVSTVHDSIDMDCPSKEVVEVAKLMAGVFKDIPANVERIFKYKLPIKMPCEVKVGNSFANQKELDKNLYLE